MRFRIETEVLKKAVDAASRATSTSNLTPILENILIEATEDKIVFTGNNLEMSIEYTVDSGFEVESEWNFTIESKFFQSYISLVQDSKISVDYSGWSTITLETTSGKTKLNGIEASKFPVIPSLTLSDPIRLHSDEFRSAIDKTSFSAAEWNVRPMLAGIYMNPTEEKLIFASTDSFRLSDYSLTPKNPSAHAPIIIPKKTAQELSQLINQEGVDEIEIYTHESQMLVHVGRVKMTSRLLSGKFPEYSGFFPKEFQTRTTVQRSDFINALKQVDLVAKFNSHNTKIRSLNNGSIEIFTGDTTKGTSTRVINATVEGNEDTIGINSEYLLAALGAIKDDYISFEYKNPLSPIVIRGVATGDNSGQEYRHLIMPLKI